MRTTKVLSEIPDVFYVSDNTSQIKDVKKSELINGIYEDVEMELSILNHYHEFSMCNI